jgi:hypothetical protein
MLKSIIIADNIKLSVVPLSMRASISKIRKKDQRFIEAQMK